MDLVKIPSNKKSLDFSEERSFGLNNTFYNNLLENILDYYSDEELMTADGFDNAVIGIDVNSTRIIYSVKKCIEILCVRDEMELDEAIEFFEYNVSGSYHGPKTPIWCEDLL